MLPLSTRLRQDTKTAHTRAERSGIMHQLITGTLERERYVALLAGLLPVYRALEEELDARASHPHLAPLYDPALHRLASLEADLRMLAGPGATFPPLPAAEAYAARIHAAATEAPALLVAHAYTRYLGDLSGGQILKRKVMELWGGSAAAAVTFYEFPAISDLDAYKQRFRGHLDALPLDAPLADRVVAEAVRAFELNSALFAALE